MEQIKSDKQKKTNPLPWIVGLLILGLFIWGAADAYWAGEYEELTDTEENISPLNEVGSDVGAVIDYDYLENINSYMTLTNDMEGDMGLDHEFSHNAIRELSDAVIAIAEEQDVILTENIARARQLADDITNTPYATDHAEKIRMAAINLTESLERIDTEAFRGMATEELKSLRQEAQSIDTTTLTLDQKEDVRSFFQAARRVLIKML